jgi:hypothetical protein
MIPLVANPEQVLDARIGGRTGLNAEFNCSAWYLCTVRVWRERYTDDPQAKALDHEVYVLDGEDGYWSISMRYFNEDEDQWVIEDLLVGTFMEVLGGAMMMKLSKPQRQLEMVAEWGGPVGSPYWATYWVGCNLHIEV